MNRSYSLSECVGQVPFEGGTAEVFASIDAQYHADRHEVEVTRTACLRPDAMERIGEHVPADWLPAGGVVKAGCEASETSEVARDIFHSWVRDVKESIPGGTADRRAPDPGP